MGVPRSDKVPDALGGGISRDNRPLSAPRAIVALSAFSRADSAVQRGGGSGRTRSRSTPRRSEDLPKSLEFGSMGRRSLLGNSRSLSPSLLVGRSCPLGSSM